MDLLGGSVGMNVEPQFTMPSSLLRMRDSGEQVKSFSVSGDFTVDWGCIFAIN